MRGASAGARLPRKAGDQFGQPRVTRRNETGSPTRSASASSRGFRSLPSGSGRSRVSSNAETSTPTTYTLALPGKAAAPDRWRLAAASGRTQQCDVGVADCRSARCGVRAAWDGFAGAGRHEREQAPTASSGTAACPGVATLLLNAQSRGCLLASTSGAPGGCSGVALAMRPMLVAPRSSPGYGAGVATKQQPRGGASSDHARSDLGLRSLLPFGEPVPASAGRARARPPAALARLLHSPVRRGRARRSCDVPQPELRIDGDSQARDTAGAVPSGLWLGVRGRIVQAPGVSSAAGGEMRPGRRATSVSLATDSDQILVPRRQRWVPCP
jgi:hypothetical protein